MEEKQPHEFDVELSSEKIKTPELENYLNDDFEEDEDELSPEEIRHEQLEDLRYDADEYVELYEKHVNLIYKHMCEEPVSNNELSEDEYMELLIRATRRRVRFIDSARKFSDEELDNYVRSARQLAFRHDFLHRLATSSTHDPSEYGQISPEEQYTFIVEVTAFLASKGVRLPRVPQTLNELNSMLWNLDYMLKGSSEFSSDGYVKSFTEAVQTICSPYYERLQQITRE